MIAGRLNKRIVIEHTQETRSTGLGEELPGKKEFLNARADVVWGNGKRIADLEIIYSYEVTFIVWLYLKGKVAEGDVITYAGKEYRVISLEPEPETKILYIRAQTA